MNSSATQRFFYEVHPWSDESLLNSYQVRLREKNRIGSWSLLSTLLGYGRSILTPNRFLTEPTLTRALGLAAGISFDLSTDAPVALPTSEGCGLKWRGGFLSIQFWMQDHSQVCPACLREKGYLDTGLDYWHLPVCTEHKLLVVDCCHKCGHRLSFQRAGLAYCGSCGADLRNATSELVAAPICEIVTLLTNLKPVPLVTPTNETTLTANQIAAFIGYFASGENVTPYASRLPSSLTNLTPSQRVQGLSMLTSCFVSGRIVATRLRESILRRARFIHPFRGTPLFHWWLRSNAQPVPVGIRVANAIEYNSADDISHFAVHRLGSGALRANSSADAAKALDVTPYEFEELCRWVGLMKPPKSIGYDMDDLSTAQDFLAACLPESVLDQYFGINGITAQLAAHRLISVFSPRSNLSPRYSPDSVVALLKRVDASTSWSGTQTDSLACAAQPGNRPTPMTAENFIKQLAPGRLFSSWPFPFRLSDICPRLKNCPLEHTWKKMNSRFQIPSAPPQMFLYQDIREYLMGAWDNSDRVVEKAVFLESSHPLESFLSFFHAGYIFLHAATLVKSGRADVAAPACPVDRPDVSEGYRQLKIPKELRTTGRRFSRFFELNQDLPNPSASLPATLPEVHEWVCVIKIAYWEKYQSILQPGLTFGKSNPSMPLARAFFTVHRRMSPPNKPNPSLIRHEDE